MRPSYVDQRISYEEVRVAFRTLALKHHPDTANCAGRNNSKAFFLVREAFEAIAEGPNGIAILRDDHSFVDQRDRDDNVMDGIPDGEYKNVEDVDPQILREVADVAKKMNPGGLDKGGMWQYANMIRNMAEENRLPPLRVGGGDNTKNEETGKRLGRRRKRK